MIQGTGLSPVMELRTGSCTEGGGDKIASKLCFAFLSADQFGVKSFDGISGFCFTNARVHRGVN